MNSRHKYLYKRLIKKIADALTAFMDEMPDDMNGLQPDNENDTETKSVKYSKRRIKQKPLGFD